MTDVCFKMALVKRAPNVNQEQKDKLIEFVKTNPHLREGKFTKDFTYKDGQKMWVKIANSLNAVPEGGSKSWKQWRKVWQDLKTKSKHKTSSLNNNNKTRTCFKMAPMKRAPNVNQEQKDILIGCLSKNPHLMKGKFTKAFTYKDGQIMWVEIANLLNAVPDGGSKSWKQWRKVWQDLKTKSKNTKSILNNTRTQTSSRPPPEVPSDASDRKEKSIQRPTLIVTDNLTNKKIQLKEDYYNKKLLLYEKHLELLGKDVQAKCDIADSLKTLTNIFSHNITKHENYDF